MVWPAARPVTPSAAHDFAADSFEQNHGPAKRGQIPIKRPRNQERGTAGAFERNGLGHQFAKNDMQDGERSKGQDDGKAVGHNRGPAARQPIQQRAKELSERGSPKAPMARLVSVMPTCTPETTRSSWPRSSWTMRARGSPRFHELAHARGAHGHQRELRGGEEAVDGHQQQHGQETKADHVLQF